MIKIFNSKLGAEILIDESVDWIQFNPRDYEEIPYVIIEFKEFDFPRHAIKCSDCRAFMDSLGSETVDWYITYSNKKFRLNLKHFGQDTYPKNQITVTMSDYNPGTKLTLVFHELPTDKEQLDLLLKQAELDEDYENACVIRDLINEN
jgi:hypothetical protein